MTPLVPVILVVVFVLGPIARAVATRVSRGGPALPAPPSQEVALLREEVERLGAEVARLNEEQAFMLRLLAPGEQKQVPGSEPPPA
ncbi:MAG: hypothetical protein ABW277_06270 [Longimicrobiaceae bacterium]